MCRISSIQAAPAYVSSCHRVIYTTSFLLIGQDFLITSLQIVSPASSVPTVSALWLRGLLQAAEALGLDPQALLQGAEIPAALLSTPYARISLTQNLRLWRQIENLRPQPDTGLRIGEMVKPSHFQLFALTLMHSDTLAAAFTRSMRYTRLLSDGGHYFLTGDNNQAAICYEPLGDDFSHHQVDAVLVLLRSFANWLACRTLPLLRVEMRHPAPADLSEYQRIFAAPLQFSSDRNALVFAPEVLAEPLALGDEQLSTLHEQMLEAQLALLNQPDTAGLVRHFLQHQDDLQIDRDQVAARLHMSGRTLQRKLQECGTKFQQLLDEERCRRAQQLLRQSDLPLTVISERLGFAESSVFSRAFRRWSAISPLEYRRAHQDKG